jgi:predicted amidohydrolase YtcJ
LCQLYAAGRIQLRLYDAIYGPSADADRLLSEGPAPARCGDKLAVRGIKLYIDGALGSRGAALLEPYSDSPASRGLLVNTPEALFPLLTAALRRGIQVETHSIGDRIMLDLYERALTAVPVSQRAIAEPRWRIEHARILSPADMPRFAHLGVIASMQPSHAISDLFFAPARLGPERLAGAYAWHSLRPTSDDTCVPKQRDTFLRQPLEPLLRCRGRNCCSQPTSHSRPSDWPAPSRSRRR